MVAVRPRRNRERVSILFVAMVPYAMAIVDFFDREVLTFPRSAFTAGLVHLGSSVYLAEIDALVHKTPTQTTYVQRVELGESKHLGSMFRVCTNCSYARLSFS